jgi:hypothetical protein
LFAVPLKIRTTGFAGRPSASQKLIADMFSLGEEETGEGERKTQIKLIERTTSPRPSPPTPLAERENRPSYSKSIS